jgi:hypothetical protein
MLTAPRIISRFNGNRDSSRVLVRECWSPRTVRRWARGTADGSSGRRASKLAPGWGAVLVGTKEELLLVGAHKNIYGRWIWVDDRGFEITVEEVAS